MSLSVSDRLQRVRPSATGAVLARALELRQQGIDVINLGTGEPDFETPEHIRNAAIAAIRDGRTRYTAISGTPELKDAIIAKLERDNSVSRRAPQILVSNGAKQSLFNLCQALLSPGDEVVIAAPYWVSYPEMVKLAGAEPVIVPTSYDTRFKLTPDQLASALSPRTRLVMFNSPCNPTGASYSASDYAQLGRLLTDRQDIVVATDDIYEHIFFGGDSAPGMLSSCPGLTDRTVLVNGVSKAYAMTGWRIGYAAGPEWLIQAMTSVQSQSTSNPCSVSQAAAVAALNGSQDCVREMTARYRDRRDLVVAGLNEIPGLRCHPSEGSFYAFPDAAEACSALGLADDVALCEYLLDKARVALVPGSAFGAPGCFRLSYAASSAELTIALDRLKSALSA